MYECFGRLGERFHRAGLDDLADAHDEQDASDQRFRHAEREDRRLYGHSPIAKTETGLAAVLGHEVAHVTAHHQAERVSQTLLARTITDVGKAMSDDQHRAHIEAAFGIDQTRARQLRQWLPQAIEYYRDPSRPFPKAVR